MSSSGSYQRSANRAHDAMRPVSIELGVQKFAEGSALISFGDTKVLAAASIEERVPPFKIGSGEGWATAEYAMLPRATHTRNQREVKRGKPSGRTSEIQRLIGRSLRAVLDFKKMGERTLTIDCDVLQADGGTRTASITAAYIAGALALGKLYVAGDLKQWPFTDSVSAISVGLCDDTPLLDLEYTEDSAAQVDMNVVVTGSGRLVEVQGTGERRGFSREELDALLDLALKGTTELAQMQRDAVAEVLDSVEELQSRGRHRAEPKDPGSVWGKPGE
ncbi:MAG: ribonuclease PH [Acidobacteriota bacterium]